VGVHELGCFFRLCTYARIHQRQETVVYGDAVDDLVTTGLLAQGVHTVVERGRFISDPLEFLPTLA